MSDISGLTQSIAVNSLRSFIEKIERLENEKSCIADDIKEVYNSLKIAGFDAKAAKSIVKLRKQEDHERKEAEAVLELYKEALGLS